MHPRRADSAPSDENGRPDRTAAGKRGLKPLTGGSDKDEIPLRRERVRVKEEEIGQGLGAPLGSRSFVGVRLPPSFSMRLPPPRRRGTLAAMPPLSPAMASIDRERRKSIPRFFFERLIT
jgi:hypothetical protein